MFAWLFTLTFLKNNTHGVNIQQFVTVINFSQQSAIHTKMFEMLAHEHGLRLETLSPFVDSSVDNVLLQINPDSTSCFLNSSIFLNVWPI